jgi:PIN domain nuclease of toxin-antitoxin system
MRAEEFILRMGACSCLLLLDLEATSHLPLPHRDPFDRMLVAQARVERLTLVTQVPAIRSYPGLALLAPLG